ncbi:uncharacterized protein LOC121379449 [Gigantopelta aegis]|uniref:uncharacterized protein LOC121379449 n=1 Tax=Gigantopelta aegis TaxID=1735272 RepID=UPI001B88A9CB|nr:uncharacterized protein LOC121379449 [Gigantopelta aegis]
MPSEYLSSKLAWPPAATGLSNPVKNDFPVHLKNLDLMQETRNVKLSNALFYSVLKGRLQKTKFLIDQGINVNARNDHGYNPLVASLHIDKDSKRRKMFRLLLQNGANPLARDVPNNRDVLSWACLLGCSEQVVTLLTDFGGDIHLTDLDRHGLTAFHYAIHSNKETVVRSLITIFNKYNISVDIQDGQGMTPYVHARRLGYVEIADLLRNEGNASIGHADNVSFKSPREWSQIGRFERQWDDYHTTKKELDRARICGRLNRAKALKEVRMPSVPSMTSFQDDDAPSLKSYAASDVGPSTERKSQRSDGIDWSSSRAATKAKDSRRLVQSVCTFPPDRMNNSKPPVLEKRSYLPMDTYFDDDIDAQSIKTRFSNKAALNLLAMTSDKGKLVARFHSSKFDESKSSQYHTGNVSNFLTILSDQSSSSYRQSVTVPPPHVPTPPAAKHKPKHKSNVSTLAIIMGRQRSGSKKRKTPNLSKAAESRRNKNNGSYLAKTSKTKNKSKHFVLPNIKLNDRAF